METLWCLIVLAVAGVAVLLFSVIVAAVYFCVVGAIGYVLFSITDRIKFCEDHEKVTTTVVRVVSLLISAVPLVLFLDFVEHLV